MSLAELKKSGKVKSIPIDKEQIRNLIELGKRDLVVAKKIFSTNFDWCFIVAYNSMLQSSRALMFSYGYTTSEEDHHKTVVEFSRAIVGGEMTDMFDRMRRKRHEVTYDEAGQISEYTAKHALETATKYLDLIEKKIRERI